MPEPTFTQEMVDRIEAVLLESVGMREVTVNGTKVAYDQAERLYNYWKGRLAREQGSPRCVRLDLSGDSE